MPNPPYKTITAIIGITILDAIALLKGIDGKYLVAAVIAIAGLGGYSIIRYFQQPKE